MASLTSHQPSSIALSRLRSPSPSAVRKGFRVVGQRNRSCELGTNCRGSRFGISELLQNSRVAVKVEEPQETVGRSPYRSTLSQAQPTECKQANSLQVKQPPSKGGFFLLKKDCKQRLAARIPTSTGDLESKSTNAAAISQAAQASFDILTKPTVSLVQTKLLVHKKELPRIKLSQSDSVEQDTMPRVDSASSSQKSNVKTSETSSTELDTSSDKCREQKNPPKEQLDRKVKGINLQELLMSPSWQNKVLSFEQIKPISKQVKSGPASTVSCLKTIRSRSRQSKDTVSSKSTQNPKSQSSSKHYIRPKSVSFSTNVLVYTY